MHSVCSDLALRNILLDTEDRALLNDFGMSRALKDDEAEGKTVSTVGPVKWMVSYFAFIH